MGLVERQNDRQVEFGVLHAFSLFSCRGDVAYYERHLIHRRYVNSLTLSPHGSTN